MFRDRFWLSLAAHVPVLFWSEMVQDWLGFTAPTFPHADWIPASSARSSSSTAAGRSCRGGVREVRPGSRG